MSREMTADDIGVGPATLLARRISDAVYDDLMDRRFLKWLFDPEHGGLYALDPSVIAEIRDTWAAKIEKLVEPMFRLGGIQRTVENPKPCEHDWEYTRTDYHGSHKGEDAYRCRICHKREYRA